MWSFYYYLISRIIQIPLWAFRLERTRREKVDVLSGRHVSVRPELVKPKVKYQGCAWNPIYFNLLPPIEIQHYRTIADRCNNRHQESKSCEKMMVISSSGFESISAKYIIDWFYGMHSASSIFRTKEAAAKDVEGDWSCCHKFYFNFNFRVEQVGSAGAAHTATRMCFRRWCFRFKPDPLANLQPPALRTSAGIRPVLDQSESLRSFFKLRNIFDRLWARVGVGGPDVGFTRLSVWVQVGILP